MHTPALPYPSTRVNEVTAKGVDAQGAKVEVKGAVVGCGGGVQGAAGRGHYAGTRNTVTLL